MPFGMIVLFVVAGLVYFGVAQRVLDRMRLTDGQAFAFLAAMFLGGFIDVSLTSHVSINVGGAVVPLALCGYLLVRADTARERWRPLIAAVGTAAVIWVVGQITDFDAARGPLMDPVWLYSLIGGATGYIAGRSRRGAFIAGTLGIVLIDLAHLAQVSMQGIASNVAIGGAGVFDAVVLAGFIAVVFAEVFGETRERLQGGPEQGGGRPRALKEDEGIAEADGRGPSADRAPGEGRDPHA